MTSTDNPRWMTITGQVMSGIVILFLLMDGGMKMVPLDVVGQTMATLGWPADDGTARMLGILTLVSTLLYAFPQTAVLGAILMTAYLGGAIATHVRIANPLFTHSLFGVYLGLLMWGGLWLRTPALRTLLPISR